MLIDLNHESGFVYGRDAPVLTIAQRVNRSIDAALLKQREGQAPRDYLGASRIGEPCARRLCYELANTPADPGKGFSGLTLRVFDAGHRFEALSVSWLRSAGFELRTTKRDGSPFGFSVAGGRIRGHIDGVIVAGPDIGVTWPVLWEHKAINLRSWQALVKHGLKVSKDVYYAQVQLYMAYLGITDTLFTAVNKNTQELAHERIGFDPAEAQALSDRAVAVVQAVDAGELLPRIAAASDHYLCRFCPYARRCWRDGA